MTPRCWPREAREEALRARDWPNLGQYRDANRTLAGVSPKAVFIGDSLTEFWLAGDPGMFRYGLISGGVINRGISGQTSPQILLRFMADVIQLKPAVVHLLCGGNDLAGNTGPTTFADYQNNIIAMVTLARLRRARDSRQRHPGGQFCLASGHRSACPHCRDQCVAQGRGR